MLLHGLDWRIGIAILAFTACSPPERQLETGRRYISTVYLDTTRESFDRTTRAVTGLLVEKSGDSTRFRIRTRSDETVAGVDFTLHPASRRGSPLLTSRVGMPKGTLPLMGNSVAFLEQLLRRTKALGGDSLVVRVMQVGAAPSTETFTVVHHGTDSVILFGPDRDPRNALHLAVDSTGRVLGGDLPLSGLRIRPVTAPQ